MIDNVIRSVIRGLQSTDIFKYGPKLIVLIDSLYSHYLQSPRKRVVRILTCVLKNSLPSFINSNLILNLFINPQNIYEYNLILSDLVSIWQLNTIKSNDWHSALGNDGDISSSHRNCRQSLFGDSKMIVVVVIFCKSKFQ